MKKKKPLFKNVMQYFEYFKRKAEELLTDDEKITTLLNNAENKLKELPKVGDKLSMLPVLIAMIRSYVKGEYRNVSKGTIITVIGTLIYVLSPIDAVLDKIPIIGMLDDIFIINLCLSYVQKDVDNYKDWQVKNMLK